MYTLIMYDSSFFILHRLSLRPSNFVSKFPQIRNL